MTFIELRRGRGRPPKGAPALTPLAQLIVQLYVDGLPYHEIADRAGTTTGTVGLYVNRFHHGPKRKRGPGVVTPDVLRVILRCAEAGMSGAAIAREVGVDQNTVTHHLRKRGFRRKSGRPNTAWAQVAKRQPPVTGMYACPRCGAASPTASGHPNCHPLPMLMGVDRRSA